MSKTSSGLSDSHTAALPVVSTCGIVPDKQDTPIKFQTETDTLPHVSHSRELFNWKKDSSLPPERNVFPNAADHLPVSALSSTSYIESVSLISASSPISSNPAASLENGSPANKFHYLSNVLKLLYEQLSQSSSEHDVMNSSDAVMSAPSGSQSLAGVNTSGSIITLANHNSSVSPNNNNSTYNDCKAPGVDATACLMWFGQTGTDPTCTRTGMGDNPGVDSSFQVLEGGAVMEVGVVDHLIQQATIEQQEESQVVFRPGEGHQYMLPSVWSRAEQNEVPEPPPKVSRLEDDSIAVHDVTQYLVKEAPVHGEGKYMVELSKDEDGFQRMVEVSKTDAEMECAEGHEGAEYSGSSRTDDSGCDSYTSNHSTVNSFIDDEISRISAVFQERLRLEVETFTLGVKEAICRQDPPVMPLSCQLYIPTNERPTTQCQVEEQVSSTQYQADVSQPNHEYDIQSITNRQYKTEIETSEVSDVDDISISCDQYIHGIQDTSGHDSAKTQISSDHHITVPVDLYQGDIKAPISLHAFDRHASSKVHGGSVQAGFSCNAGTTQAPTKHINNMQMSRKDDQNIQLKGIPLLVPEQVKPAQRSAATEWDKRDEEITYFQMLLKLHERVATITRLLIH